MGRRRPDYGTPHNRRPDYRRPDYRAPDCKFLAYEHGWKVLRTRYQDYGRRISFRSDKNVVGVKMIVYLRTGTVATRLEQDKQGGTQVVRKDVVTREQLEDIFANPQVCVDDNYSRVFNKNNHGNDWKDSRESTSENNVDDAEAQSRGTRRSTRCKRGSCSRSRSSSSRSLRSCNEYNFYSSFSSIVNISSSDEDY